MIRTFCDNCGDEIVNPTTLIKVDLPKKASKPPLTVLLNVGEPTPQGFDGARYEHTCNGCLVDGLAKMDKRPKIVDEKSPFDLPAMKDQYDNGR